ncbi:MAG: glutaredoxin domain-containing protein, partial [Nitrososphaeraceae archaeon]|nr:glutaredoxin domain-containing protein [Nitrososphaeraceae archaeon]
EMDVFKTAREIDQIEILRQAADRQEYICQSQSLNLFGGSEVTLEELYEQLIFAWVSGIKTLYYFKGKSKITNRRDLVKNKKTYADYVIITKKECPYCIKLKDQLKMEGKSFKEIPLEDAKNQGIWVTEWKTVPQLFIDGKRIGGYSDYVSEELNEYSECASCEG